MLALLAAAALAAAQPAPLPSTKATPQQRVFTMEVYDLRGNLRSSGRCEGAALLQTSYEPALLLRPQDREAARLRKLIELPMGKACLLSTPDEEGRSPK